MRRPGLSPVRAGAGRAGAGPARRGVLVEQIDKLPTPLAKAQLGAAFAQAARPAARRGRVRRGARRPGAATLGRRLRQRARGIELAIALLLKESGLLPDRLSAAAGRPARAGSDAAARQSPRNRPGRGRRRGAGPGRPAGAGRGGRRALPPAPVLAVALDRRRHRAQPRRRAGLGRPSRSPASRPTPPPAARKRMRISRKFFDLDGQPLEPRSPAAEHGLRAAAGRPGGGRAGPSRHVAAGAAGGMGDRRAAGRRRGGRGCPGSAS